MMPYITLPYIQPSVHPSTMPRPVSICIRSHVFILLLAWFCVALGIRYGCYGDMLISVGPSSSRLIKINSVMVKTVEVKGDPKEGMLLHGFKEKPDLTSETYLTVSNQYYLNGYGRKGFFMWLNKGSKLQMFWNVEGSNKRYHDMLVLLIKGEQNPKESQRFYRVSARLLGLSSDNGKRPLKEFQEPNDNDVIPEKLWGKKAEYTVPDDDNYYFSVVNLSPTNMITTLKVNATSKIYDTSNAVSICSNTAGTCRLDLSFPSTRYFVVTTNDASNVNSTVWNIEVSFIPRVIAYLLITAFIGIVIYLIMRNLGVCDAPAPSTTDHEQGTTATETDPMLPTKEVTYTYGATEDAPESSSSICCSGEDLYDGKICVICYEAGRDCFFIPCGHSVTCFACGQRILAEDNKVCPICRRLIHKLRRLFN